MSIHHSTTRVDVSIHHSTTRVDVSIHHSTPRIDVSIHHSTTRIDVSLHHSTASESCVIDGILYMKKHRFLGGDRACCGVYNLGPHLVICVCRLCLPKSYTCYITETHGRYWVFTSPIHAILRKPIVEIEYTPAHLITGATVLMTMVLTILTAYDIHGGRYDT